MFGSILGDSDPIKGMLAVQELKETGTVRKLSLSQIVYLITSLQDAQKHLNNIQFNYVRNIFNIFRKKKTLINMNISGYYDACAKIINMYEQCVPYLLFDGNCSEHLSADDIADIWLLYQNNIRFNQMADYYLDGTLKKHADEFRVSEKPENAQTVIVFHVARNLDGSIQPIVAAPLCPTNTALLKSLLQTDVLGIDNVSHYGKDFYHFLFNAQLNKPYPSVMIIKYKKTGDEDVYLDMQFEDSKAVQYAIDNYL